MKLRTLALGCAGLTVVVLVAAVVAWAFWLRAEKAAVKALQDEMRAAGWPVTSAEVTPAPAAADNAGPLLEQAATKLEKLRKGEGWIDAIPSGGGTTDRNPAGFDPDKLERFRAQMARPETQEILRLLREGSAKHSARFARDVTKGPAMELGPVPELLTAARLLGASAWLAAREGREEAAAADLLAAARIGGFLRGGPVLIDWLVGIAIDALTVGMAAGVLAELPTGAFEAKAWGALAVVWTSHRDGMRPALASVLDGERVLAGSWVFERMAGNSQAFADFWKSVAGPSGNLDRSSLLALSLYAHPWSPLLHADHAAYLRFMRDLRREVAGGGSGKGLAAQVPQSAFFTRLSAPALDNLARRADEVAAQLQLGCLGLSLERWRAEHGSYPEVLTALRLPLHETADPFRGHPLGYRVEGDGVLVYSVGPDGKDDGGNSQQRRDIVWRVTRGTR